MSVHNQSKLSAGILFISLMAISSGAIAGAAFNTASACFSPDNVTLVGTAASTGPQLSDELFNYGKTAEYGQQQQATCTAFINGVATCTATLTGLDENTTYHFQFYGTFSGCGANTCTQGTDNTFQTCAYDDSEQLVDPEQEQEQEQEQEIN